MTTPQHSAWSVSAADFRRFERTVTVGAGDAAWERARTDLLAWRVKTRSGFRVVPDSPATPGGRHRLVIGLGRCAIREPVEVTVVVDEPDRVGYAYRTLPGHPLDGEEAFIVSRHGDEVRFTLRSLSRPAPSWLWRLASPAVRIVQVIVRRRYLSALRRGDRYGYGDEPANRDARDRGRHPG